MMQQQHEQDPQRHVFTASEVAEYEYCPLVWWHEQFEPLAHADKEELFARLVELEDEHASQAPALPEYQMVEQLLLRLDAFAEGRQRHGEHAEQVEEIEEERISRPSPTNNMRRLTLVIVLLFVLAVLLIVAALVVH